MTIDEYGRSGLHYAPQHKPVEQQKALAERLVDEGLDVNLQDARGRTPLHFAAQGWSIAVATVLIERGAVVDTRDEHGNTPLSNAVFNSRGRGELIKLLLEAGAVPEIENDHGISPRSLAGTIANFDVKQHLPEKA